MPSKLIPTDYREDAPVKNFLRDDTKFASSKIAFFQYLTVAIFLFLVSGFWQLQVQNPDYYLDRAARNRIRSQPIQAPRGKILDRDGRVIVDSHSSFSLSLARVNLKPEHLKSICEGLDIDYPDLVERLRRFDRTRARYESIIVKDELTAGEIAFVEAHRGQDTFPEMELIHAQRRLYPRGGLAAHVIGYTGEVSEQELNTTEFARFRQGDVIGKAGIERQHNDTLMGVDGQRRVIVDNVGRVRKVIDKKEASSGRSLTLTIDLDLQVVAELAMENRRGAVVAFDPRTGEVLAMVSRPAYDPNKFAGRIRSKDWMEIRNHPENPLLNRSIQAQLAPGSTFKPFIAMAALAAGVADPSVTFHCGGGASFYGRYFRCHSAKGHGSVDLHKGMIHSCDVYFYNLGNRLSIDKIAEWAELAGFGKRTGIDLPGEAEGIVPSTRWKVRNFRQKWYAGETISVAIGQGALTVTPLQMAHAVGGLIMGGVWHKPHLVRDPSHAGEPKRSDLDASHVARVLDGLYGVVNEGGTAARSRIPGIEFCGKTGTAQPVSRELQLSGKLGDKAKDNAWFFGFAPKQDPEIVVVALYEAGEHGPEAAPIVRDVIKAYFDKKARTAPPPVMAAIPMREEVAQGAQ
ncbi:MAG: penicillin-binding protein 2 [Acidimicrobiia bacterium]|nr:penicillin-binding protein 2 [Acidimicrobiia bacterium]